MKTPLLAAAVILLLLAGGCHKQPEQNSDSAGIKAENGKIVLQDTGKHTASVSVEAAEPCRAPVLHLNGRLAWDEDVTVRVFTPFAGRVTKIVSDIGKEVRKGETLALIAAPDYGQAQADYHKAVAAFNLAQRNLTRTKDLFEHGAAAQKDLFSAESDFETAQSEIERCAVRLRLYGGNTNSVDQAYELKTLLDGVVVEKNVNPGQEVRADAMLAQDPRLFSPLFVVTDPSRLWVLLEATELDVPKLRRGQEIVIHSRAYTNLTFTGQIDVIGDSLDPSTKIVKVRGSVANPERLLKAEMFVDVDVPINAGMTTGADVPKNAIFGRTAGEKGFVFLEESPGHFERREITVGPEHGEKVSVLGGIAPGQRVVTEGCLLLNKILQDASGS